MIDPERSYPDLTFTGNPIGSIVSGKTTIATRKRRRVVDFRLGD
jgi:hypothetical protein